jgi:MFS family permease
MTASVLEPESPTPPVPEPATFGVFYGWWIVAVTFLTQFVAMGTVFYSYGILLKPLAQDLSVSRLAVGSALPAMMAFGGMLGPLIGREVDRRPVRVLFVMGTLFLAGGFLTLSRATTLWHFYLAFSVLVATGNALLGGLANTALVSRWFVRSRGTALGISQVGVSLSGMVMAFVTTWLLGELGWRGTAVVFAVVPVVLVAPLVWLAVVDRPEDMGLRPDGDGLDAGVPEASGPASFSFRDGLRDPNVWLIALVVGINFAALGGVVQVIHSHVTDLGYSPTWAASVLSVMAGSAAVGKPGFGWLADHTAPRPAMTLSIAMQAAGLGIILLAPGQLGLLGAAALFGLGYGGVLPLWGVLIGVTFGREVFGRVMGAMGPLIIPFQMLGVPFATWIYDRNGSYDAAFGAFIGLYVVASGILLLLRPAQAGKGPPARP